MFAIEKQQRNYLIKKIPLLHLQPTPNPANLRISCWEIGRNLKKLQRIFLNDTGWSKETVDCNFFLTDPNFLKSAITQWFLESLYREVLVFGYFKSVRCMEFCLMESFHYRAFPAPYMAWTLIYTLRCIQATNIHTLHLYALRHLLQVSQN